MTVPTVRRIDAVCSPLTVIRTLAKPISSKLKQQAQDHEAFRNFCINIAQTMHRYEMGMRVNLLGETTSSSSSTPASGDPKEKPKPHIRALSETKAIATGANFISESFLFLVAVSLILGEQYRGYRKDMKRRDLVAERLESLETALQESRTIQESLSTAIGEKDRQWQSVLKVLDGVVDIGMKHGEMRRILENDKELKQALGFIQMEQQSTARSLAPQPDSSPSVGTLADAVPTVPP